MGKTYEDAREEITTKLHEWWLGSEEGGKELA